MAETAGSAFYFTINPILTGGGDEDLEEEGKMHALAPGNVYRYIHTQVPRSVCIRLRIRNLATCRNDVSWPRNFSGIRLPGGEVPGHPKVFSRGSPSPASISLKRYAVKRGGGKGLPNAP